MQNDETPDHTLMTTDEVSAMTRVKTSTLRYWRHQGNQGPRSFLLGKRIMYKRTDVEAWIEDQYNADQETR